ncbi:MAG TPA: hypothetical protein VK540_01730 [Polyangiaceae bacterium]|nr:hypothetical protein [Polyangiaceae bacterium]
MHRLARRWPSAILLAGILGTAFYVIAYPFTLATHPPITDLPFHAAGSSILRHYLDPAFHFREQYELHFLEVPYATMYFLGAFFAVFVPIVWATKLTAIVMLSLLPGGLAVMFLGMKKSPLWGVLGLGPVWCSLTHWGFLNFMGAIGLFTMASGATLLLLDRPTRGRQAFLIVTLVAIFYTHVYRFPFAVAAILGTAVLMYPATRRWKPVLLPLTAAMALYGFWSLIKRAGLSGGVGPISVHKERMAEIPEHLFTGYVGPEESAAATQMLWVTAGLFLLTTLLFFLQGRHRRRSSRELFWGAGVTALPLIMGAVFLLAYLVLPMSIGLWWFVYPREITTAGYVALAAMPDLPRKWWLRLPLLASFAYVSGRLGFITAAHWHDFEQSNEDFRAIAAQVPKAPKLLYLIFDHGGSARRTSPYIHMPAWIQAETGGWLSFHAAGWGDLHPIRYRPPGPSIPPPVPERWEWTPERFDLQRNGSFFDTFLVRHYRPADYLFAEDPSIHPAGHVGHWWLYRRDPPGLNASTAP